MKSIIAAGFLLGCAQGAIAGPYANVEANSGFYGSDYGGTATDVHVGYEGQGWYIQGGPALVMPNGADNEVEFAGKFGGSVAVSEKASVYGELSGMTGDELSVGTKLGMKYSF